MTPSIEINLVSPAMTPELRAEIAARDAREPISKDGVMTPKARRLINHLVSGLEKRSANLRASIEEYQRNLAVQAELAEQLAAILSDDNGAILTPSVKALMDLWERFGSTDPARPVVTTSADLSNALKAKSFWQDLQARLGL